MGNLFTSDPRFYHHKRGHLLQGPNTVTRGNRVYTGEFQDGWLIDGQILDKNDNTILACGGFKFNYLIKGSCVRLFKEIVDNYVPYECIDQIREHFNEEFVHVIGQFDIDDNSLELPTFDNYCTIYYDAQHTKTFINAKFDKGRLINGSIMLNDENNTIVASGEFRYNEYEDTYVHDGVLLDELNENVMLVPDNELYLKISPLDTWANHTNDYTGYAEYYYDASMRNLIIKCDLKEGEIHGNFVYMNSNNVVMCGEMIDGYFRKGIMLVDGFYVSGDFNEEGKPYGLAKLYHDVDCKRLYATVNFAYGKYHGKFTEFDSLGNIVRLRAYSNGELISEITETPDSFTATLDKTNEVKYERYSTKLGYLVRETEVMKQSCIEPTFTFILWLENKLIDKLWLSTLNQSEESFFEEYVGCEIESILDLASKTTKKEENKTTKKEENKISSNKNIFANVFIRILQNPGDYMLTSAFAETLLADIYNEYLKFLSTVFHCKMLTMFEYTALSTMYFNYIKKFKTGQTKTSLENWLVAQFENNYTEMKNLIGNDILNVVKSRSGKNVKDGNKFVSEILHQLQNPVAADTKNGRDKKMKTAYNELIAKFNSKSS